MMAQMLCIDDLFIDMLKMKVSQNLMKFKVGIREKSTNIQ